MSFTRIRAFSSFAWIVLMSCCVFSLIASSLFPAISAAVICDLKLALSSIKLSSILKAARRCCSLSSSRAARAADLSALAPPFGSSRVSVVGFNGVSPFGLFILAR